MSMYTSIYVGMVIYVRTCIYIYIIRICVQASIRVYVLCVHVYDNKYLIMSNVEAVIYKILQGNN